MQLTTVQDFEVVGGRIYVVNAGDTFLTELGQTGGATASVLSDFEAGSTTFQTIENLRFDHKCAPRRIINGEDGRLTVFVNDGAHFKFAYPQ